MSIIANIRQFLRLDKETLVLENEYVYSVGLYVNEWRFYEPSNCSGCFCSNDIINHHPTDSFHFHQPIHFSHC